MNKKFKVFLALFFLLSGVIYAQPYYGYCTPEPMQPSPFCGGYVGANFNFGALTLDSQISRFGQLEVSAPIQTPMGSGTFITFTNYKAISCEYKIFLNTVGGGLTVGYNFSPGTCWLIGVEFNGLFYGNPGCNFIERKTHSTINITATLENNSAKAPETKTLEELQHKHSSNIRLDGILRFGLILPSQFSMLYLLGGASGINIKTLAKFFINGSAEQTSPEFPNKGSEVNCCINKWLAGGTVGAGIQIPWSDCLNFFVEARYARYQNLCFDCHGFNQASIKFIGTPQMYTGLVGINWSF